MLQWSNPSASPRSQGSSSNGGAVSQSDKKAGEEVNKKRKVSAVKEEFENLSSGDDFFTVSPSLVTLGPGVRITNVAAGGRHTLALSGKPTASWVTRLCTLANFRCRLLFLVTQCSFVGYMKYEVGCLKFEAMEDF